MKKDKELGGKLGKKRGNTKSKDCKTKTLVLGCVAEKPATVGEIFERTGFTGTYKSLAGMIRTYHDYGYLYRNGYKPFTYTISELGLEHLENPRLAREALIERRQANAVAVTRRFLLGMDEESRKNFLTEMGIQPVEQHITIAKHEPAKPDKVTVKAVNENIKVIDSKPATDLPKPSVGLSGSFDTNDYDKDKIIAEQLETIHDQAQTIEELRNTPVHITVPKQITSASPSDDLHKHDALYLKYKNRIVDSAFFNELRYGLYEFTGTDSSDLSKAVCDILNSRVLKKGHIIFESYNAGGALKNYKQARRLSEEELEKYPPTLQFGKEEVNLSIRYKNHTYNFFICSVASLKKPVRGFVNPPKDIPHSEH